MKNNKKVVSDGNSTIGQGSDLGPFDGFTPALSNNLTRVVNSSDLLTTLLSYDPSVAFEINAPVFVQNKSLSFPVGGPNTPYPFSRLAWTNSNDFDVIYIYHQLNNSMLAEDAFHLTSGWHTTEINIGTNN
jgi:hypothetical protein